MKINSLLHSIALSSMSQQSKVIARSLERLASGKAYSRASDGIVEISQIASLNAQLRGQNQAIANINTNYALIGTASSALSNQIELTQKIRELGLQASNGSLGLDQRRSLQTELTALMEEFDRISRETEFNGFKLLDGSVSNLSFQNGNHYGQTNNYSLPDTRFDNVFTQNEATGLYAEFTGVDTSNGWLIDLNGDGLDDMLSSSGGNLLSHLNDGTGNFNYHSAVNGAGSGLRHNGLDVSDVDSNGFEDLVTTSLSELNLFLSNGDGSLKHIQLDVTGYAPISADFADINNDGNQDVVSLMYTGEIFVYLGDGVGNFSNNPLETASGLSGVFSDINAFTNGNALVDIADTDLDGNLDIVLSLGNTNTRLLLGDGQGSFGSGTNIGTASRGIELFDLNGDNYVDLVTSNTTHIQYALGSASGFGAFQNLAAVTGARAIQAYDINGDGLLDFSFNVSGDSQISYYLNDANGLFESLQTIETGMTNFQHFSFGDINADQVTDFFGSDFAATSIMFRGLANVVPARPNLSLLSTDEAQQLIKVTDAALEQLIENQTQLGIQMNLHEQQRNQLELQKEAVAGSLSQTQDIDYGLELAELTQAQIRQQASLAALTQANSNLQLILQLLK